MTLKSLAITGATCAAIFILDCITPLGIGTGFLYIIPVLYGLWLRSETHPLATAAVVTVLASGGYFVSPGGSGVVIYALLNRGIAIVGIWSAALIVSRTRRLEVRLHGEEAWRYRIENIAEAILLGLTAQGTVSAINRKACEILGYEEKEIVGCNWFELCIPARMRDDVQRVFGEIVSGKQEATESFTNPVVTSGGEERLIAWHNVAIRDPSGQITGVLSSGQDVTEQMHAKEALRRSTAMLEDFKYALDQSAIVAMTDVQGKITYANDQFCTISGYGREELLGKDHRIINSGIHPKEFIRDLWDTIRAGRVWRGEICNRAKNGSLYWVDTTIVPFFDEEGALTQYVAIRSDITARKLAEGKLREQETLVHLGRMAAVVAHEVKNPLAGIAGAVEVIGDRFPRNSTEHNITGEILKRIGSLNQTIQDLLLYARPREPKRSPVALDSLVQDTAAFLGRDPAYERVNFQFSTESLDCFIDGELFREILLNLYINAAQAMNGVGTIRVEVYRREGNCCVIIRDQGPGISADILPRIFEPFFTTKSRGTGLGLATAKRVIEAHGGTIEVNCPPDGGTVITVRLHDSKAGAPAVFQAPE